MTNTKQGFLFGYEPKIESLTKDSTVKNMISWLRKEAPRRIWIRAVKRKAEWCSEAKKKAAHQNTVKLISSSSLSYASSSISFSPPRRLPLQIWIYRFKQDTGIMKGKNEDGKGWNDWNRKTNANEREARKRSAENIK